MLITKTFCKAGSLVYIVPTGLLVTLRYDAHGKLGKVFKGFHTHEEDVNPDEEISDKFVNTIFQNCMVPGSIKITGTTTSVWGVFYSDDFKTSYGKLPECEYDRIIDDISSGNIKYKF